MLHLLLSVIVRVPRPRAPNFLGGGVIQTPREFFSSKNMETYHEMENSMINLYEIAEKVILINPFRPSHKKLPYTALFSRNMTLKIKNPVQTIQIS